LQEKDDSLLNQHHDHHHHHSSADKPIGIITDRLIVTVGLITDKKPSKIKAEGLMQELGTRDADIAEAAKLLQIMTSTESAYSI
jgi:hypothetical protein